MNGLRMRMVLDGDQVVVGQDFTFSILLENVSGSQLIVPMSSLVPVMDDQEPDKGPASTFGLFRVSALPLGCRPGATNLKALSTNRIFVLKAGEQYCISITADAKPRQIQQPNRFVGGVRARQLRAEMGAYFPSLNTPGKYRLQAIFDARILNSGRMWWSGRLLSLPCDIEVIAQPAPTTRHAGTRSATAKSAVTNPATRIAATLP